MSGYKPFDPVSDGGNFQPLAPSDGQSYLAEGSSWVNALTKTTGSLYQWSDDITATDPGTSTIKINNADESLATKIYVSGKNFNGQDLDSILVNVSAGDSIVLRQFGAQANFIVCSVTEKAIDNTGWFELDIAVNDSGGGFTAGVAIEFVYVAASPRVQNVKIERLLDGEAIAINQDPLGLGPLNAIRVEFGAAVGTVSDPVMLDATGQLTVNESGLYCIKISLQYGRLGSGGTSILLFRAIVNGNQAGRSIVVNLPNANSDLYFENDNWVNIEAGTVISYEVMRDEAGSDSGGLIGFDPTVSGGNEWNKAPSASLRVERLVNCGGSGGVCF